MNPPCDHAGTLAPTWSACVDEAVSALAWSPDGDRLVAGSLAGDSCVLQAGNGHRTDLERRSGGVLSAGWSEHGDWLALGGQDANVMVAGQDGTSSMIPGRGWVNALAWAPRRLLLAVACGSDVLVVSEDGSTVAAYPFLAGTVNALAWTAGGHLVAATLAAVHWFSPGDGSPEPAWTVKVVGAALALSVSTDGERVAVGLLNGTLAVWQAATGEGSSLPGYEGGVERLTWRHDGRQLAIAAHQELDILELDADGAVTGAPTSLSDTEGTLGGLDFHPTLGVLASGGLEGEVSLWATRSAEPLLSTTDLGAEITALAWSPRGDALAVGARSGEIHHLALGP